MRAIRPVIIVQTSPMEIEKGSPLVISARFYNRETNMKQRVSKIYLNIISLKNGDTIWPVEVVRKNDWKMDIEVGSDNMKDGHDYLVRISNNRNLSPQGATEFKVRKGGGKPFLMTPLAISTSISLLPLVTKAIQDKFSISEIELELKRMFPDMTQEEIDRLKETVLRDIGGKINPVDDVTKKMIERKRFVTQMDSRVCPICLEAQDNSSPGLPMSEYEIDDIDAPRIPLHFNCRCTFDIIFNEQYEASFEEIRDVFQAATLVEHRRDILKAVEFIGQLA
jgi:hypothetical protein